MPDKFLEGIQQRAAGIEKIQEREIGAAEVSAYIHGEQQIVFRVIDQPIADAEAALNEAGRDGYRLVAVAPRDDARVVLFLERAIKRGAR